MPLCTLPATLVFISDDHYYLVRALTLRSSDRLLVSVARVALETSVNVSPLILLHSWISWHTTANLLSFSLPYFESRTLPSVNVNTLPAFSTQIWTYEDIWLRVSFMLFTGRMRAAHTPVFKLRKGRFWVFSPRRRDTLMRIWRRLYVKFHMVQKNWIFYEFPEYYRPEAAYPLLYFNEIFTVYG